MQGHQYEVFVLEPNPVDKRILLSGGHDGQITLWDIISGVHIKTFHNAVCTCCFLRSFISLFFDAFDILL